MTVKDCVKTILYQLGHDDLYPFVLPTAVLEKMKFIHTVVDEVAAVSGKPDPVSA